MGKTANKNEIPYGYCHCGCGQKTAISKASDKRLGYVKGEPKRFVKSHSIPKSVLERGHIARYRGINSGGIKTTEHKMICERAIGKPLPTTVQIHHVNENILDNTPSNLVVCQDAAYHKLLHLRAKALKTCGNPNFRRCRFCNQYDDSKNLTIRYHDGMMVACHHNKCRNAHRRSVYKSIRKTLATKT